MTENNMNQDKTGTQINHLSDETREDIQARQIAGLLNTHTNLLSMRTLKQLENGREQAVKAHMRQVGTVNGDGTVSSVVSWAEHYRSAAAGMVLGAIIVGFVLMNVFGKNVEHGDAFLLAAELPPEAFVDTAFEPSLNVRQAKL